MIERSPAPAARVAGPLAVRPPSEVRPASRPRRVAGLDALRGLAVALMVPANAAAELLREPHPLWLRLVGSLAAPLFVTLAGLLVAMAVDRDASLPSERRRGGLPCVRRGAFVILVGVLIDVGIGGYLPLVTCDVLYLIGLSLPLAYLAARGPRRGRLAWPWLVLAATPIVQSWLGYRVALNTPALDASWLGASSPLPLATDAVRRSVVDGWFPVFPWLGFALLGVVLAGVVGAGPGIWPIAALVLIGLGAPLWYCFPGPMAVRCGYSELFYPATVGFLATAAGVVSLLVVRMAPLPEGRLVRVLGVLGRRSLLFYVVHLFAIRRLGDAFGHDLPLGPFLVLCTDLLLGLLLLGLSLEGPGVRRRRAGPAVT
jgi:uncharacterized membrane protein